MPEVPEVKLTVDFLNRSCQGKYLIKWNFTDGKYTEDYPEGYINFYANLPLYVSSVKNKGKFIYFNLESENKQNLNFYVLHSLRMTGRWQIEYDEYCKWYIEIVDDPLNYSENDIKTIWFRDPRSFATLIYTDEIQTLNNQLNNLGPDIMTIDFTIDKFQNLTKKYENRNITSFLMDQKVISGCGNYIKSEVLYSAKISPLRKVKSLSAFEKKELYTALCTIPKISYNNLGLSLHHYANEHGQKGCHDSALKIYGKSFAKREKTADGRTTYWDPRIQK